MTKAEIQAALKAAADKAAKLNAKADRTPEEDTELDSVLAEAEKHDAALKAIREREKADAERQAKINALSANVGQPTPRVAANSGNATAAGASIRNIRLAAEDDPCAGFKSPRELLSAVMDASRTGRTDERLAPLRAAAGSDEHGEYSDAYGGFLIPAGFAPDLLKIQSEVDPTAGKTQAVPMSAPTIKLNARTDKNHTTSVSGGLQVYRRAETDDVPSSRMKMEQITLSANMLMGVSYATEEVLTDSPVSFVALLEAGFNDEFASKILQEKLRGTGAGEYEGILNSPAKVIQAAVSSQGASTIVGANIVGMRSRAWRYGQCIWLANHDTLPQLAKANLTGDKSDVFLFNPSRGEDVPDMLLGRPIYFTEYCSTLGTEGDLILFNPSQYLEGTLEGRKQAESIHVRFLQHERTFKFWTRNDGRLWWRSALTPHKGSNTLSPVVTLNSTRT